jgi:O-antigen/teichoic acid export membrane protein
MPDTRISENSKRVAKNTVLLYFRMFVMMLVGLYTSRVILNALGQDDFGIYGAVGGVVAMFSILTGAIAGAISRFLTFELGKSDDNRLSAVFSTAMAIQLGLALIILLVAEVAGIWFLNAKMNIPDGRMGAANWVLQCSILMFLVNM